jgi:predicted dienelactone hydrolase
MKFSLALALILTTGPGFAETSAGVAHLSDSAAKERPLALSIWYPSDVQASTTIGGNAVFQGALAAPDAPLPAAPLPLVVVSHGGLRSAADSGAWLSSSIARAGFIVAEVNASRPENATVALNEMWRRPQDISRAVDLMLSDDLWGARIDKSRISVVGFALGATAALSVAGAKIDVEHYMQSCTATDGNSGPDCAWYAAQGVMLTQTNQDGLARLMPDPRFASAIAVDPEYLAALGTPPENLATLLVSLGSEDGIPGAVQFSQSVTIPDASAFDAFAACTEAGPGILIEEEGDASICGASTNARKNIHRELSAAITSFLVKGGK